EDRRAGRHEGRYGGPGLLHRAGRHLGVRAQWRAARDDPHAGGAGQSVLRRARHEDAVLHRPHLGLFAARQGAGPPRPLVPPHLSYFTTRQRGSETRIAGVSPANAAGTAAAQFFLLAASLSHCEFSYAAPRRLRAASLTAAM